MSYFGRVDDFVSHGSSGAAGFTTALLKCLEARARGFAHGHGKVHRAPHGTNGLCDSLVMSSCKRVRNSNKSEVDREISRIIATEVQSYNKRLTASASKRQYESATLPARQVGQFLRDTTSNNAKPICLWFRGGWLGREPLALAHIARELAHVAQQMHNNVEPMTGFQLCCPTTSVNIVLSTRKEKQRRTTTCWLALGVRRRNWTTTTILGRSSMQRSYRGKFRARCKELRERLRSIFAARKPPLSRLRLLGHLR